MTWLTAILLALNGAALLTLIGLWWWTKVVDCQPKTIPEAAVRGLYYLARWLKALAEAGDSGILCFREMRADLVRPRAELFRYLKAEERAHAAELEAQLHAAEEEAKLEGGWR